MIDDDDDGYLPDDPYGDDDDEPAFGRLELDPEIATVLPSDIDPVESGRLADALARRDQILEDEATGDAPAGPTSGSLASCYLADLCRREAAASASLDGPAVSPELLALARYDRAARPVTRAVRAALALEQACLAAASPIASRDVEWVARLLRLAIAADASWDQPSVVRLSPPQQLEVAAWLATLPSQPRPGDIRGLADWLLQIERTAAFTELHAERIARIERSRDDFDPLSRAIADEHLTWTEDGRPVRERLARLLLPLGAARILGSRHAPLFVSSALTTGMDLVDWRQAARLAADPVERRRLSRTIGQRALPVWARQVFSALERSAVAELHRLQLIRGLRRRWTERLLARRRSADAAAIVDLILRRQVFAGNTLEELGMTRRNANLWVALLVDEGMARAISPRGFPIYRVERLLGEGLGWAA